MVSSVSLINPGPSMYSLLSQRHLVRGRKAPSAARAPPVLTISASAALPSVPNVKADKRGRVRGLDERGRRTVAEDRAQRAILGVDVFGIRLGRDQQDSPRRAGANQSVGQRQSIDETRAAQVEVQRPADVGRPSRCCIRQAVVGSG